MWLAQTGLNVTRRAWERTGSPNRSLTGSSRFCPAARISSTVFFRHSASRPTTTTWKPSVASLLAVARPIPLVPASDQSFSNRSF